VRSLPAVGAKGNAARATRASWPKPSGAGLPRPLGIANDGSTAGPAVVDPPRKAGCGCSTLSRTGWTNRTAGRYRVTGASAVPGIAGPGGRPVSLGGPGSRYRLRVGHVHPNPLRAERLHCSNSETAVREGGAADPTRGRVRGRRVPDAALARHVADEAGPLLLGEWAWAAVSTEGDLDRSAHADELVTDPELVQHRER
jgi:hypothetical protein